MQIQTSSNLFSTFRPVVASSRSNTGSTATNLADANSSVANTNERQSERAGDALLRRIDAGDLRGTRSHRNEFRFGRRLVQRTRHEASDALRDGAKDILKGVKNELRSAMRELGDDRETRKEVRDLYKDFRREVKDIVKSTRSSRQFDTSEIAEDLESAFTSFSEGLRDAFASSSADRSDDNVPPPASVAETQTDNVPPPASVAETRRNTNVPPPASVAETARNTNVPPPASVAETARNANVPPASVAETRTDNVPPPNENEPPRTENELPPASVAETESRERPDFDGLFSSLDSVFKGGLSKIVDGINDALERANEAFERFRSRNTGGDRRGGHGRGRFVDRAA